MQAQAFKLIGLSTFPPALRNFAVTLWIHAQKFLIRQVTNDSFFVSLALSSAFWTYASVSSVMKYLNTSACFLIYSSSPGLSCWDWFSMTAVISIDPIWLSLIELTSSSITSCSSKPPYAGGVRSSIFSWLIPRATFDYLPESLKSCQILRSYFGFDSFSLSGFWRNSSNISSSLFSWIAYLMFSSDSGPSVFTLSDRGYSEHCKTFI